MRAHRGWSQCVGSRAVPASLAGTAGLIGAGTAGLLVIAGCAGAGSAAQAPPAKVTIVSGNLTFSSATAGEPRGAGSTHRTGAQKAINHGSLGQGSLSRRAGDAFVAGLSGPGTRGAAQGTTSRARAAQPASRRSGASQGAAAPVDLRPDLGIRIAVRGGGLTGVSVRTLAGKAVRSQTAAGQALPGTYAPGSRSWRTRWALAPSQTYRVTATAVDPRGQRTVMASTFSTLRPRRTFTEIGRAHV